MNRSSSPSSGASGRLNLGHIGVPRIPWLDHETAVDVVDIAVSLAERHPEVQAVILFGSVARHDERPLDDPVPSDVDLLLLLDASVGDPGLRRLTHQQDLALRDTIGEADYRHRTAPREVKVIFMYPELSDWDPAFIENVARDGIVLWSRAPLPRALAPVAKRMLDPATPAGQPR